MYIDRIGTDLLGNVVFRMREPHILKIQISGASMNWYFFCEWQVGGHGAQPSAACIYCEKMDIASHDW